MNANHPSTRLQRFDWLNTAQHQPSHHAKPCYYRMFGEV